MDISDFLASMQPDPQSRTLAHATHMGIPDTDNDTSTKDAAPSGYSSKWDELPESENIDDRRDGNFDDSMTPENMVDMAGSEPGLNGVMGFADGGEVPEEEQDQEVTGSVTEGAIPDDQAPDEQQSIDETGNVPGAQDQEGDNDWLAAAKEGISKAIDLGYNRLHAVNRPVSDESHAPAVHAMLSGEGALDPQQWDQVMKGVDPDNSLDPASKQMKGLGELYKFYGGDQKGAEAVWGAVQHQRNAYNALRAHALVGIDNGAPEVAAKAAQSAFNVVPDGILTKITAALFNGPSEALPGGGTFDRKQLQNDAGIKDIGKPDGGMLAEDGKTRITNAHTDEGFATSNGGEAKFHVEQIDPESKKTLINTDLTAEQMRAVLSNPRGFDALLHGGTVQAFKGVDKMLGTQGAEGAWAKGRAGDATSKAWGQPQATSKLTFGQSMAKANGLPEGMDVGGMSVSQINALRGQYAQQQLKSHDEIASRERMAAGNQAGMRERTEMTNRSALERAHIAAGHDPATGQPLGNDPAGRQATFRSAQEKRAFDAAKAEVEHGAGTGQKVDMQQALDKWRKYYGVTGQQPQQQAPAAAQPGQADQRRKMLSGEPVPGKDGKMYRYNPATKMMDPV